MHDDLISCDMCNLLEENNMDFDIKIQSNVGIFLAIFWDITRSVGDGMIDDVI